MMPRTRFAWWVGILAGALVATLAAASLWSCLGGARDGHSLLYVKIAQCRTLSNGDMRVTLDISGADASLLSRVAGHLHEHLVLDARRYFSVVPSDAPPSSAPPSQAVGPASTHVSIAGLIERQTASALGSGTHLGFRDDLTGRPMPFQRKPGFGRATVILSGDHVRIEDGE